MCNDTLHIFFFFHKHKLERTSLFNYLRDPLCLFYIKGLKDYLPNGTIIIFTLRPIAII